jgi:hypothetical protein
VLQQAKRWVLQISFCRCQQITDWAFASIDLQAVRERESRALASTIAVLDLIPSAWPIHDPCWLLLFTGTVGVGALDILIWRRLLPTPVRKSNYSGRKVQQNVQHFVQQNSSERRKLFDLLVKFLGSTLFTRSFAYPTPYQRDLRLQRRVHLPSRLRRHLPLRLLRRNGSESK